MVCLTNCSLFYLKEKNKLTLYKQLHTHKHFEQINIRWGNQNSYIEEGQTMQCPKEKWQKYKQQSTKHTYKTKDR